MLKPIKYYVIISLTIANCFMSLSVMAIEIADRIWFGGPILTMNDAAMRVEAVAEQTGRIIAVGPLIAMKKIKGDNTKMIDLAGYTLLPGFVDAHSHMFFGGLQELSANLLAPPDGQVTNIASLQQIIRDWIMTSDSVLKQAHLVIGFGYDDSQLAERRHPTRNDLDLITQDMPVIIVHQSGHIGVMNSKALTIVGYTSQTSNPPGGIIRRNVDSNEPNGVIEEAAFFSATFKLLRQVGAEAAKNFARNGAKLWASFGYTTAEEGRASAGMIKVMREIADANGFNIDVVAYPDVLENRDVIKQNVSATYHNHFRVAGAKLTIDGSPQGFTAWRDRPYYQPVGNYPPGYTGYSAVKSSSVIEAIDWVFANNVQIITHANGEAAIDLLLAAMQAAIAKNGLRDERPVLIHGQFMREDQVDTCNRLKVMPSLFPMHTFYWGDWHREHTVGPELADNISPTGWVMKRGMRFSTHHDAPVTFPNSMRVLDATVTRRSRSNDIIGPQHRVDVITALKAMTIWPAWQKHEETIKGSLEIGKFADFVVLSQDPTAIDSEMIDQIQVLETIKEGLTVFKKVSK